MEIKQLDYLCMIRVDCSFWAARAKLQKEDLPPKVQQSMPPDQIATLGSKRLFPADKLKIFNTLKARAHSALDRKCVRFLGGWATHERHLPELAEQLAEISAEFERETQNFLNIYVEGVAGWVANFPGWEGILLNAVPKVHELKGKFGFTWQMFKLAPQHSVDGLAGNNLNNTLTTLELSVIDEVAKDIKAINRDYFAGKVTATKKTFKPMHILIEKIRGLGFIHSHLVGLEQVLMEVVRLGETTPENPVTISMFKSFLTTLSVPEGVQAICDDFCERNKTMTEVIDPFWSLGMSAATIPPVVQPPVAQPTPVGLPTPPPGWIPPVPVNNPAPPVSPVQVAGPSSAVANAIKAIDDYVDYKLGIEPVNFTAPESEVSHSFIDNKGLW